MIPDGWSKHFLGDVCKISSGVGFPVKFQGRKDLPIPFIKVSDMNSEGNEKYVCFANNTIDNKIQECIKAPIFPKGCLVLPKVGAALLTNKRRILAQPTAVDNNVMVLMSKSMDYEFLYYWSLLIDMANYVQSGALPSINKSTISQIQITLPPEKEQKKIAAILSSVDDAIQATQAVIDQTRRVKQGLLQQLLTRGIGHTRFKQTEIGEIPEDWSIFSLEDISSRITYGFTNPMPTTEEGPWMVTAKDVFDGHVNYNSARHTSRNAFEDLLSEKSRPKIGDVLITKDGTLGRVAVVDQDEICINQSVALIQPDVDHVSTAFLAWYLQSPQMQKKIIADAGGSAIKHIYITKLAKTLFAIPPKHEQDEIVARIETFQKSMEISIDNLETIQKIKRGLMQDLLTGRVRVKPDEVNTT